MSRKIFSKAYKRVLIKILRFGNPKGKLPKYPKRIPDSEKIAIETFLAVLKDEGSSLFFDLQTNECFLKSYDSSIYLFLETVNLKIVNTVFGYDIPLARDSQAYLMDKFRMELAKRRRNFKSEALKKVKHSLEITYNKLTEQCQD
jgi:hypothetical protein